MFALWEASSKNTKTKEEMKNKRLPRVQRIEQQYQVKYRIIPKL